MNTLNKFLKAIIVFFLMRNPHRKIGMLLNPIDEEFDQKMTADRIAARIWHGMIVICLVIAFHKNTTSFNGVYVTAIALLFTLLHLIWKEYKDEVFFENMVQPWREVKYLLRINSLRQKMTGYASMLEEVKTGKTLAMCKSSPFMRDLISEFNFSQKRVADRQASKSIKVSTLPRLQQGAKL